MHWFWGCSENKKSTNIAEPRQSIEAFVSSKYVSIDEPIILFVEVYQDTGWSHRALLISSSSLRVEWVDTTREDLGTGIRTVYQYRLLGTEGSHIIEPILLYGAQNKEVQMLSTEDIFVDIGGKKEPTNLEGLARKENEDFSWYWIVAGLGGTMVGWYLMRREQLRIPPPTREEKYRSAWGLFVQQEEDDQKRAIYLSSLLRRYLGERFGLDIEHATPDEAQKMVLQSRWPEPVRDSVLRMLIALDGIRFAGTHVGEDVFAELGRSLEVVFTVGNTP